jgi:tRNA threonylcarbamoyladenosine biosynthesis protein TsaE
MSVNEEYITNSSEETQKLGENFSQKLKGGDFIAFYGELGSGKTTFIQGLARGLGIQRRIISPTFIIMRIYDLRFKIQESGPKKFYHVDLYRTGSRHDLLGVGLDQIIQDQDNIVALEWAEKMGDMLPKKRIDIKLEYLGDNKRRITVTNF